MADADADANGLRPQVSLVAAINFKPESTSHQATGGETMLDPVRDVQHSEVNCLFSRGTLHLTSPNPWLG